MIRPCDAKIPSMLNTHSISFYDPYRERNRNSALELKKKTTHSKKRIAKIALSSEFCHVTPYGQSSCVVFFDKRFFRIPLQDKKHVRRNVNPETVMIKKIIYARTVFFLFFRTLKKAYYRRKKTEHKKLDLSPLPNPQRGGGVECRIDTSTPSPFKTGLKDGPSPRSQDII